MPELINGFDASIKESIKEWKAAKVGPAGIDIGYHSLGQPDAPAAEKCDAPVATGVTSTGVCR